MRGSRVRRFERALKRLFDRIDGELEDTWGTRYNLHPARMTRGATANPETDGLFNVGASFTTGFGSRHGRGYVIEIRTVTLENVSSEDRRAIREYVLRRANELLPEVFPDRALSAAMDGNTVKIVGDLSL